MSNANRNYVTIFHDGLAQTASSGAYQRCKDSFGPLGLDVRFIDVETLHDGAFAQDSALSLFVLPGIIGDYCNYPALIGARGSDHLKQYVANGGALLKICAGSYHGARNIEYRRPSGITAYEPALLDMFHGTAHGPLHHEDHASIEVGFKTLRGDWARTNVAYHKGPALKLSCDQDVEILARYNAVYGTPVAIASRNVGNGLAIFSGPHIEIQPLKPNELAACRKHPNLRKLVTLSDSLAAHQDGLSDLWDGIIYRIIEHGTKSARFTEQQRDQFLAKNQRHLQEKMPRLKQSVSF